MPGNSTLLATITERATTSVLDGTAVPGKRYWYYVGSVLSDDFTALAAEKDIVAGYSLLFESDVYDLIVDKRRRRIYASLPKQGEIAVISTETNIVTDRIAVPEGPKRMRLSLSGDELFVALEQAAAIAAIHLDTKQRETIELKTDLVAAPTHDVIEVEPGRLFVSVSHPSGQFSQLVTVRRATGVTLHVAGKQTMGPSPTFLGDPAGRVLYVGNGDQSPEKIYKLDVSKEDAPILQESNVSVGGVEDLAVAPDGSKLFVRTGEVLAASSLQVLADVGLGYPALSSDGSLLYSLDGTRIRVLSATSFSTLYTKPVSFSTHRFPALRLLEEAALGYLRVDRRVYVVPLSR